MIHAGFAAMLIALSAPTTTEDHPFLKMVRAKIREPEKPFVLIVRLQSKDGREKALAQMVSPCVTATRQEKGCVRYDFMADPDRPGAFVIYERWANLAALENHLKLAHFATLMKSLPEVMAGDPDIRVLLPVEP